MTSGSSDTPNPRRWWTKREMYRLLLLTALLWLGLVASLGPPLHNGNVALLFLLALVGSKTYIFGQMFLWVRDDARDVERAWDALYERLGIEP